MSVRVCVCVSPSHAIFLRGRTGVDCHSSKNWCGASAKRGALKTGRCSEIQAVRAVRAIRAVCAVLEEKKSKKNFNKKKFTKKKYYNKLFSPKNSKCDKTHVKIVVTVVTKKLVSPKTFFYKKKIQKTFFTKKV